MQAKTYLMCPPEHFTVSYAINPWMTMDEPVDRARAARQWQSLYETVSSRSAWTCRSSARLAAAPSAARSN
jgi:N-dimethylarginine dimethylaminohydrolase